MPSNMNFRAALHGYNREDVVAFIDKMTRDHEKALRRMQERNDQLRDELAAANEALAAAGDSAETDKALSDAQTLIADLQARNAELEEQLEALSARQESPDEEEQAETVPMPISQDLEAPIPPVQEVLPVELKPSKDYTELELAAYRRAELAERMARERAGDVYRQIQSTFSQANAKLDTGRADLEQLSRTLTNDVNEMLTLLTNLNAAYSQAEASFSEIGERNRALLENEN